MIPLMIPGFQPLPAPYTLLGPLMKALVCINKLDVYYNYLTDQIALYRDGIIIGLVASADNNDRYVDSSMCAQILATNKPVLGLLTPLPKSEGVIVFVRVPNGSYASAGIPYKISTPPAAGGCVTLRNVETGCGTFDSVTTFRTSAIWYYARP